MPSEPIKMCRRCGGTKVIYPSGEKAVCPDCLAMPSDPTSTDALSKLRELVGKLRDTPQMEGNDAYCRGWKHGQEEASELLEALLPALEQRELHARLEEAERTNHESCLSFNGDGSKTGLECSCRRGKRIAELRAALNPTGAALLTVKV